MKDMISHWEEAVMKAKKARNDAVLVNVRSGAILYAEREINELHNALYPAINEDDTLPSLERIDPHKRLLTDQPHCVDCNSTIRLKRIEEGEVL